MLKKAVRLGILAMLVASFMVGITGTQPAKAVVNGFYADLDVWFMNVPWNGSLDPGTWDWSQYEDVYYGGDTPNYTIGEMKAMLEAELGYKIIILAAQWITCDDYADFDYATISHTTDSAKLLDYVTCPEEPDWVDLVVFEAPKTDTTRLTLYGYIKDDGQSSCTLWSLDGSKNIRPSEKCGADVELVCTVKLVDKELKYDCKDGYDWLGYNIAHDPKWVSWADKFAQRYGR